MTHTLAGRTASPPRTKVDKQTGEIATRLFSCLSPWFQLSTEPDHLLPSLWGVAAGYTMAVVGSLAALSSPPPYHLLGLGTPMVLLFEEATH